MLLFLFISRVLQYGNRWHSQRSKKFILVTKEIRLFHLMILLTSLNIYSDRPEKLGNWIRMIYSIVSSKQEKDSVGALKIFNIIVFKKIDATS